MPGNDSVYITDVLGDRVIYVQQGWGVLGIDTCTHAPNKEPSPLRIGDMYYEKGLGNHAPGEIVVDLGGRFKTFQADIGVQWQNGDTGTVVFKVVVDGQARFDSGVLKEADGPRSIDIDVRGAEIMKLIANDAGDGITCDCANWADARLIPDPNASDRPEPARFDAAPFAWVVTSDPQRKKGTAATRTQPFPENDILLDRPIAADDDGTYQIPRSDHDLGCIGLLWPQRRLITELGIQFSDGPLPDAAAAHAEYWAGESRWQGRWESIDGEIQADGNRWTLRPEWPGGAVFGGTEKIRWIFENLEHPVSVQRMSARTRAHYHDCEILIRAREPKPGKQANIEIYNGRIADTATTNVRWNMGEPIRLALNYTTPLPVKYDATVLSFRLPDDAFTLSVEDILDDGALWAPEFDIYITTVPPARSLAEYIQETAEGQTVLDEVRARPDQSFDSAMRHVHHPVQNRGPTMLSLACDNRKFVVERDGSFGPYKQGRVHPSYTFEVTSQFGEDGAAIARRELAGEWLPAPRITAPDAETPLIYRQTAFVVPARESPDDTRWWHQHPLFVAEYEIENRSSTPHDSRVRLALSFDGGDFDRPAVQAAKSGAIVIDGDRLLAHVDVSDSGLNAEIEGSTIVVTGSVPPKRTARFRALLPGWNADRAELEALQKPRTDTQSLRAYWLDLLADAMRVEIPNRQLDNLIKASQIHCLMAARNDDRGERIKPWIASDRYGPLESEGHSIALGMDLFGHHDFARRCLDFYIANYKDPGYLTTGYTTMGTGQHLWTLARHCRLSDDDRWLDENAAKVRDVCAWVARQTQKTKKRAPDDRKIPEYGLVPPGVIADWNRYAYRFYMQAHYCAGLTKAAHALSDIGYPGAHELETAADEFSNNLMRAYQWARARTPGMELSDGAFIPGIPPMLYCFGTAEEMFPAEDYNRSWAGDVETGSHHMAALGVIPPHAPDVEWMAQTLEDYWYLHEGMADYPADESRADPFNLGGFAKIQPFYGRLNYVYALRDDVKPFIRSYFNAIPSLLNEENLSLWEHFSNSGAWNKTHETGWLLERTRNMFVLERDDQLWLAPFVTTHWMHHGMHVEINDAPTDYGRVSYAINSRVDDGYIEAVVEPPARSQPAAICLRLRHPQGLPIKRVTLNGRPHETFDADREYVRLPQLDERATVRAYY